MKNGLLFVIALLSGVLLFFYPVLQGKLPIPADTIIGLYHPYRDLYADTNPRGIAYKNFLITDPVRQQYPWKHEVIKQIKEGNFPVWNPYTFSGTPLAANIQSSPYYPLNIIFFFLPFSYAWTVFIVLQPVLAGIFLFLFLRELKISQVASLFGSITFAFSGFFVSWLEWGTVLHTALWLPLVLYVTEKLLNKRSVKWFVVLLFAACSQILAGHTQTWFYSFVVSNIYLCVRLYQITASKKSIQERTKLVAKRFLPFALCSVLVGVLTFLQWFPSLQFISESAREIDVTNKMKDGWFIPWQHMIQLLSPDFFGNFATQNYWGVWNYAELVGYVGIVPLLFACFALLFRRDRKTLFFGSIGVVALLFALPTPVAYVPFLLDIPFIGSSQPTRLLFVVCFSLSVLVALGVDYFQKNNTRKMLIPLSIMGAFFLILWVLVTDPTLIFSAAEPKDIAVAKRNLLYSTGVFGVSAAVLLVVSFVKKKQFLLLGIGLLLLISYIDLFRFSAKFNAFSPQEYLYPETPTISFLKKNIGNYRMMSLDEEILPPNFTLMYGIQTIEGYDPLYLRRYGELVTAVNRNKSDITPPFGFNRIITTKNYESSLIDLLGVKYILSLHHVQSPKLKKVFEEGQTKVYENTQVMPRAFFVEEVEWVSKKEDAIEKLVQIDLKRVAVGERRLLNDTPSGSYSPGVVSVEEYSPNKIVLETENKGIGFVVVTDTFSKLWKVRMQGSDSQIPVYRVNYHFRGFIVPPGKYTIEMYPTVL